MPTSAFAGTFPRPVPSSTSPAAPVVLSTASITCVSSPVYVETIGTGWSSTAGNSTTTRRGRVSVIRTDCGVINPIGPWPLDAKASDPDARPLAYPASGVDLVVHDEDCPNATSRRIARKSSRAQQIPRPVGARLITTSHRGYEDHRFGRAERDVAKERRLLDRVGAVCDHGTDDTCVGKAIADPFVPPRASSPASCSSR